MPTVRIARAAVRMVRIGPTRRGEPLPSHEIGSTCTPGRDQTITELLSRINLVDVTPPHRSHGQLGTLVARAGWRPETLARRLNTALAEQNSTRRIHEKTPYKWINKGEIPHGDVPELVVQLLAAALRTTLSFEEVWGAERRHRPSSLRADHAMDLPWDSSGLFSLLGEPVPTRRTVIALTGAALTSRAWGALRHPAPVLESVADEGGPVTPPLLSMIDNVVTHARQLDDQQGGAARAFVADQFTAVARLLRRASYPARTGQHLAAALAQLAQTSGFMAFDADDDGAAQRWYLTAIRAAHAANDQALTASVLALLSNQAADRGHALDALQLASAAQEAAANSPTVVRSLVAARSGLAHAAAGDLAGFEHLRDTTRELIHAPPDAPPPAWASYIDPVELDAITGRGLVVLAEQHPVRRAHLLKEAAALLHTRAHTDPTAPPQRSALRHGAWLSLAHTRSGDIDLAVSAARVALNRLPHVSSARSVALLRQLRDDLTETAPRSAAVRALIQELPQHGLP